MDYPSLFAKLKELGFSFREHDNFTVGFFLVERGVMGTSFDVKVNWKENVSYLEIKSPVKGVDEKYVSSDFDWILKRIEVNLDKNKEYISRDDIEAMGIISSIHSLKLASDERLVITYPGEDATSDQVDGLRRALEKWLGRDLIQRTLIISDQIKFTKVGTDDHKE